MDMTKDERAAILFALWRLRDHMQKGTGSLKETMDRSGYFADAALPTYGGITNLLRSVSTQDYIPDGFKARKIELCVKDDELDCSGTVKQLLDSGGSMIDGCMDPPAALFKIEGDDRWWTASVELCIELANPEWAVETIQSEVDAIEDLIAEGSQEPNLVADRDRLKLELMELPAPPDEEEDDDADPMGR